GGRIGDEHDAVRVPEADRGDAQERAVDIDRLIDDVSRRPAARHVLAANAGDPHGDGDVGDPPVLAADPALDDAAWGLDGEAVGGDAAVLDQPAREDAHPLPALPPLPSPPLPDL